MSRSLWVVAVVIVGISLAQAGIAAPLSFTPPDRNGDLRDLSHTNYHLWDFGNAIPGDDAVTRARLVFTDIYNNAPSAGDQLSVHLIDDASVGLASHTPFGATSDGVTALYSFVDPNNSGSVFNDGLWGSQTQLFAWTNEPPVDGSHIPVTYNSRRTMTYEFTPDEIATLNAYLANGGTIALGVDPDCHYVNAGVSLQVQTVPEPAIMFLLGAGAIVMIGIRRRSRIA